MPRIEVTATQLPEPRSTAAASHGCAAKNGSSAQRRTVSSKASPSSSAMRRELGLRRQRDEALGVDAVALELVAERAELLLDGMVLGADDQDAHQYLPMTRPPSTRR